jgi:hypothetical protein
MIRLPVYPETLLLVTKHIQILFDNYISFRNAYEHIRLWRMPLPSIDRLYIFNMQGQDLPKLAQ